MVWKRKLQASSKMIAYVAIVTEWLCNIFFVAQEGNPSHHPPKDELLAMQLAPALATPQQPFKLCQEIPATLQTH